MKVGFVAVVGRPNVGKSSLINALLNYKVSIVSNLAQTTRNAIKGIYNDDDSQIIFIDTPGIHKPEHVFGNTLNNNSYNSFHDVDVILFLQPLNEELGTGDKFIIEKISHAKSHKIALITKIDTSNEENAQKRAQELKELGFVDVLGISRDISSSIEHFISFLKTLLPDGKPFYDKEDVTDISMAFMAKEAIRESVIENTFDEVPHSVAVVIDQFLESETHPNKIRIEAKIFVERESQKGILIGAKGIKIRKINEITTQKLAEAFGKKISLELKVAVAKKWTNKPDEIKKMGY